MSAYLQSAENLSYALWNMGKFYTFGQDCSGRWCVFYYTNPLKEPALVKQGLSPSQLYAFIKRLYNAQVS